ncbi:LCP family protein [Bacillus sp. P14.5]|uniref:LCP family glycopolymer transferase n=1 Tax=Bacillus sp. P14.5 TaxID=1983400 RepID=UPI000DEADE55|nr:LCP family protein [Bacillus sp. P14.5]
MKDKDLEKSFREFHNDGLEFTEEDKKEVFRKIDAQRNRKSSVFFLDLTRRAAPLMAMAVLLTLSIVLAYSLIGDENSRNADQADKETAVESNDAETLLFLLKNEDERTDLHLLISYSKQNGSINLATLPRDTYVPIIPKRDGEPDMEKLTHINAYRDGGESVKKSVSTALDLPIDYHVTVDENDFVKLMNTIGETNLNLDEKNPYYRRRIRILNSQKAQITLMVMKRWHFWQLPVP